MTCVLFLSDGFLVQSVQGMMYNPISGAWSWTNSTSINYALHAVKKSDGAEDGCTHSEFEPAASHSWALCKKTPENKNSDSHVWLESWRPTGKLWWRHEMEFIQPWCRIKHLLSVRWLQALEVFTEYGTWCWTNWTLSLICTAGFKQLLSESFWLLIYTV